MGERLPCTQKAIGSIPFTSTKALMGNAMPEKENDNALLARKILCDAVLFFYLTTGVRITDLYVKWTESLGDSYITEVDLRGNLL